MHTISFPNIGIENLRIDRVAFTVFGREIYWYGLLITISIVIAYAYVLYRARQEHIKSDDIADLAIWVVLAGIVGARLYYVLTTLDRYESVWDMFKIWEGGLAFYGCIIGGAIAALIVAKVKKLSFAVLFDMLSPAVLIAQAIGRWGNFFNAEAFGSVTEWDFFGHTFDISGCTGLPWIMKIGNQTVQPTFLYECIWNIIGFILLSALYKRKKYNGQIFLYYIAWYGFARMLVEGFRTDSLYIGTIRISQLIGLLCLIAGIALHIVFIRRARQGKMFVPFAVPQHGQADCSPADPSNPAANQNTSEITPEQANTAATANAPEAENKTTSEENHANDSESDTNQNHV